MNMAPTKEQIRQYVLNTYSTALLNRGLRIEEVPDTFDLLEEGIIDSMGILELVAGLEDHFKIRADLETIEPSQLTIIGPLCEHVAAHCEAVV